MNVTPFQFESRSIRVITDDSGESWFNVNEVCDALGYGNPRQAVDTHVDGDDVQKLDTIDIMGRRQRAWRTDSGGMCM